MQVGDKIVLSALLSDQNEDRFVYAKLYKDGVAWNNYSMVHKGDGYYYYDSSSLTYPADTEEVVAIYEVYYDSGYTTLDSNYEASMAKFNVTDASVDLTDIEEQLTRIESNISSLGSNSILTGFVEETTGYTGDKLEIVRGEDRNFVIRFVSSDTYEPYNLTGWYKISVFFEKSESGELLEKNTTSYSSYATVTYDDVAYTADAVGEDGNTISLTFDGVDTIDTVVGAWNTANPTNTLSHDGTGTAIPPAGTIQLLGGRDAGTIDVSVLSATLGKVQVTLHSEDTNSLRLGKDLGIKAYIDLTLYKL